MKLSAERIKSLQVLLRELGLKFDDEETQGAGLAIMRFVLAKKQRNDEIIKSSGEAKNGK